MLFFLGGLAAAIAALLGFASRKPDSYRVTRTVVTSASADKLFALINDFHNWEQWSPYEKLDANMQKTFSGPEQGQGATYEWLGNKKAGAGTMKITSATPNSKVSIAMEFLKPFKSQSTIDFILESNGAGTNVTWAMLGKNMFVSKLMTVFVNMDKLIGKDFEEGLANLKRVGEATSNGVRTSTSTS
jgi:uncharacterized protein YndB with AHSA1/START domain